MGEVYAQYREKSNIPAPNEIASDFAIAGNLWEKQDCEAEARERSNS